MRHLFHGSSDKIVRVFLFLAIFCTSLAAYAQDDPIISGFGTATIDGIKQNGEWASAGNMIFDARMDGQRTEQKAFAILYVMNDTTHLFLGLVTETGLLDSRWLQLSLSNDSETAEFYFNKQTRQLLQEVPGTSAERLFETPDCCQAKFGSSQGYDMLEMGYAFVSENQNSSLFLNANSGLDLQMSLSSCAKLPGKNGCWASKHDAFLTESGKIEVRINFVAGQRK